MLSATTYPDPNRIPTRLVFTTGRRKYQSFIRATTHSPASHVIIGLGRNGEKFLHACKDGVVLEDRQYRLHNKKQRVVAEYLILPDVSDGVREALTYVGEQYDYPGLVRGSFLRIIALFASPLSSFGVKKDREQFCTRFIMLIDPLGEKIPEWRYINREQVSPMDLLFAAQGSSFKRIR